ncbi:MAG: DUF982 domain-containing protein [Mesorhizobium sp.]|nr:DUF982 domain-containing protein [Mesorhizobium sp.]MBL8579137.1 DUF982 domain-containing protein [Mesorhizobium sp.]
MRKMLFVEPVCLNSREASGSDIADVEQALQFLRDWPANRRGPVYHAAYNACTAAREGYLTVEEARRSLSGFARITGILRSAGPSRAAAAGLAGHGAHVAL